MQYEHFSRYLREKYSTRLHVADQLVDQLKQKSIENRKVFEPYFNECILAAERLKNNRRSQRDRQICYENLILVQKLERIKKQSGQNARENLEKDYRNHCRLLVSKANCAHDAIKSIHKRFIANQSLLSNETVIASYHSPSPLESKSEISSSGNDDDQATAADVDASMEYCDPTSPILCKQRTNRNFNCAPTISRKCKEIYSSKNQNQRFFETENDPIYQHLNNIAMTMIRDAMPLPTSPTLKHFSICILPHAVNSINNHSKVLSHDRQYAFKKEILYH
jgi:hypothetical protein